jgi:hypothetical protein
MPVTSFIDLPEKFSFEKESRVWWAIVSSVRSLLLFLPHALPRVPNIYQLNCCNDCLI